MFIVEKDIVLFITHKNNGKFKNTLNPNMKNLIILVNLSDFN